MKVLATVVIALIAVFSMIACKPSNGSSVPDSHSVTKKNSDEIEVAFAYVTQSYSNDYAYVYDLMVVQEGKRHYPSVKSISVKVRNDAKEYTTVVLQNFMGSWFFESAMLLVPSQNDAELWEKEIEMIHQKHNVWVDEVLHEYPRRVLPED